MNCRAAIGRSCRLLRSLHSVSILVSLAGKRDRVRRHLILLASMVSGYWSAKAGSCAAVEESTCPQSARLRPSVQYSCSSRGWGYIPTLVDSHSNRACTPLHGCAGACSKGTFLDRRVHACGLSCSGRVRTPSPFMVFTSYIIPSLQQGRV